MRTSGTLGAAGLAGVTRRWNNGWNLRCRGMAIGASVPAGLPAAQEETSMTEPGNARERGVLLAAKLHVPRPPPGFVARPRLAGRLDEGRSRRMTLVCAPAGSGKTALLAAWASGGRWPVAWLSLDEGDN